MSQAKNLRKLGVKTKIQENNSKQMPKYIIIYI